MQKSKSIFSFRPKSQQTEPRPQRRSSLDTFIIPGRTRLPSNETSQSSHSTQDAFNLQVVQSLLKHRIMSRSRRVLHKPSLGRSEAGLYGPVSQSSPNPRSGSGRLAIVPQSNLRLQRPPGRQQPASSSDSQHPLCIYPDNPMQVRAVRLFPPIQTPEDTVCDQMDGPTNTESIYRISRTTSTSAVSRRITSDSSTGPEAPKASEHRDKYNSLAKDLGLPLLKGDGDRSVAQMSNNSSQTQVTEKPCLSWWDRLEHRIIHRSFSTSNLEAKRISKKPVSRQKSFGLLRRPRSQSTPTNVLKGQPLEEIIRLGGLDAFNHLPPKFSIDQLTLPICLSATAAVIFKNGRDAPGIFRVPGCKTTIKALYNHYDTPFPDAGSPSKVEETVRTGGLPENLEYTVNDVADLFKKIIRELPGGLLGSLEIFEALRGSLLDQYSGPGSATQVTTSTRARLVALAISSIPLLLRQHLIHAVVGLSAYLGVEGGKARGIEKAAAGTRGQQTQSGLEVIDYSALSTLLGPLLLGDDSVPIKKADVEPPKAVNLKGKKEGKNPKPIEVTEKLGCNAAYLAAANHLKLTNDVMLSLLQNWSEIVIELRKIDAFGNSTSQLHKGTPTDDDARPLTPRNSAEQLEFQDILRGGTLPASAKDLSRVKSKVTVKSRSSMLRTDNKSSEAVYLNRPSPPTTHTVVSSGESRKWMPPPVPESEHEATLPLRQSSLSGSQYYPTGAADELVYDTATKIVKANQGVQSSTGRNVANYNLPLRKVQYMEPRQADLSMDANANRPFSYESSRDSEFTLDAPKVRRETRTEGPTSSGIDSPNQTEAFMPENSQLNSDSSDRDKTYGGLGDHLEQVLSDRRGSTNPVLDLARCLLEMIYQDNEESQPASRGLDNVEETAGMSESSPSNVSTRGSCSIGVLNEDVEEAKKEDVEESKKEDVEQAKKEDVEQAKKGVNFRNTRAECSAVRLAEMNREIDELVKKLKACGACGEDGLNTEALVDRDGRQSKSVLDLHAD